MNRLPLLMALGLGIFLSGPAFATGPDRSKLPGPSGSTVWAPPTVQTWTMPNGIAVWYLEQRQAPLLSMRIVLPHGASTDPTGKEGTTALMVDMLDEGAGDRDALTLSEAFQRLAADYGAAPGTDTIGFDMNLLADTLEPALALLSDVLRRPTFPTAEFDRRKAQSIARAMASEANLAAAASRVRRRVLFGAGYAAYPPSGIKTTLEAVTLDDVKAQYAALVQPQGAKIIAVGAVDRKTLEAALTKAFGDWSGTPSATVRPVEKNTLEHGIYFVDYPGSAQSQLMVARHSAGADAKDYFECLAFNRSLAGSFMGRLNLNLREDKGYTYGARGGFTRMAQAGYYAMSAKVKRDTTRASVDEMLKELADITGKRPLSAKEHEEAVAGMLKSFPGRFEAMGSVASQLSWTAGSGYPADWLQKWPGRVAGVTLAQAQAKAGEYTTAKDFVIIIAGDFAKVGPTLTSLGLPIHQYDAQGNPKAKAATPPK